MNELRLNKVVRFVNSGIEARFYTLYEDKRDVYSDCVRPEWGISGKEKNRRIEVRDGGFHGDAVFCKDVSRDVGNMMYRDIVEISKMWNPFKQKDAIKEWSENGGQWFDQDRREWVKNGQNH